MRYSSLPRYVIAQFYCVEHFSISQISTSTRKVRCLSSMPSSRVLNVLSVAKRLPCVVPIPAGMVEHNGKHQHSRDKTVFHFCESKYAPFFWSLRCINMDCFSGATAVGTYAPFGLVRSHARRCYVHNVEPGFPKVTLNANTKHPMAPCQGPNGQSTDQMVRSWSLMAASLRRTMMGRQC